MKEIDENKQEKAYQKWIGDNLEAGSLSDDEQDYVKVFDALREEPEINIPHDFAEIVTKKAVQRKRINDFLRNTMLIGLISAILILFTAMVLMFISRDLIVNIWTMISPFKIPILFSLMVFLAIQAVDRIYIPRKVDFST
jgi:hypothetical protein